MNKKIKPVGMPWSSGRLLTSAERDRKRRMNRESQLLRRERMKERLQVFDSRLGKVEKHYDRLYPTKSTVRILGLPFASLQLGNGSYGSPSLFQAQPPSQPFSQNCSELTEAPSLGGTFPSVQDIPLPFSAPRSFHLIQTPSASSLPPLPSLVSNVDQNTTLRGYLDDVLGSVFSVDPLEVCTNDIHNQDALIRGVVLGWNHIRKESFNCPLWRILSWTDELLTARTAIATRLALLRGVHLMLIVCQAVSGCIHRKIH